MNQLAAAELKREVALEHADLLTAIQEYHAKDTIEQLKEKAYNLFTSQDNRNELLQVGVCYRIGGRIKVYFSSFTGVKQKAFDFKDQLSNDIFGMEQLAQYAANLPGSRVQTLYIAAGEKDCMALRAQGLPAISFQSENRLPEAGTESSVRLLLLFSCY